MTYYISVTGLRVKNLWHMPAFARYAIPSNMQAQAAEGNISARTCSRNGIQHTLTVWKDKASMRKYMINGAHREAMKIADLVSDYYGTKVYGYESEHIPTWEEALTLWEEHGTRHGKKVPTRDPLSENDFVSARTVLVATAGLAAVIALASPFLPHDNSTVELLAAATL